MATEPLKYFLNIKLMLLFCCASYQTSKAQSFFADSLLQPVPGTDSNYIARFKLSNEVRFVYGGSDFSMLWGSSKADNNTKAANFSSNSNDYMGLGLTYKFIDADVTLALRNSALFPFERKTLRQFKLAAGFMATNNMHLRFYVNRYKGLIAFTNEGAFRSDPQLRFFKTGAQLTYVFNKERFSYRAFYSQSELQRQSAGSFLIRSEPFYQHFYTNGRLVPDSLDTEELYGKQQELQKLSQLGWCIMPGYGYNYVFNNNRLYVCTNLFLGVSYTTNYYTSGTTGRHIALRLGSGVLFNLSVGYNWKHMYADLRGTLQSYNQPLKPAYIYTNWPTAGLTVGYRFNYLEDRIPTSLF
jgi:Domain of unknown function (DUF4421)